MMDFVPGNIIRYKALTIPLFNVQRVAYNGAPYLVLKKSK